MTDDNVENLPYTPPKKDENDVSFSEFMETLIDRISTLENTLSKSNENTEYLKNIVFGMEEKLQKYLKVSADRDHELAIHMRDKYDPRPYSSTLVRNSNSAEENRLLDERIKEWKERNGGG